MIMGGAVGGKPRNWWQKKIDTAERSKVRKLKYR